MFIFLSIVAIESPLSTAQGSLFLVSIKLLFVVTLFMSLICSLVFRVQGKKRIILLTQEVKRVPSFGTLIQVFAGGCSLTWNSTPHTGHPLVTGS